MHKNLVMGGWSTSVMNCDYETTTYEDLKKHSLSSHEEAKFACGKCDLMDFWCGDLKNHEQSIQEGVKSVCDKDDLKNVACCNLKKHEQYIHGIPNSYSCSPCKKIFINTLGFDPHRHKYHATIRLICRSNFMDHVKNAHAKINSRNSSKGVQKLTWENWKKSFVKKNEFSKHEEEGHSWKCVNPNSGKSISPVQNACKCVRCEKALIKSNH